MTRYFTHYWRYESVDDFIRTYGYDPDVDIVFGDDKLLKIQTGDYLYEVTVRDGVLYLLGRLEVKSTGISDRTSLYPGEQDAEGPANFQAEAFDPMVLRTDNIVAQDIVRRIECKTQDGTKPLAFTAKGGLDRQTLRAVRELTEPSAALLDQVLAHYEESRLSPEVAPMQVFVSHSHDDNAFCRVIVAGLQDAGVDVWYDANDLDSGQLMEVIQRELGRRRVVIPILSKAAFASNWVQREAMWAYGLRDRDPSRIILPVTASPISRDDFDPEKGWLFLHDFKRIEADGYQPYPPDQAVRRLLQALGLTSGSTDPRSGESIGDLMERGNALLMQNRFPECVSLIERVVNLAPTDPDARYMMSHAYFGLGEYEPSLTAVNQAIALKPQFETNWRADSSSPEVGRGLAAWRSIVDMWVHKGDVLTELARFEDAIEAYQQAINTTPYFGKAWFNLSHALERLRRYDEALDALERAFRPDPDAAPYTMWEDKARLLVRLRRFDEAHQAYNEELEVLESEPEASFLMGQRTSEILRVWVSKASLLKRTRDYEEALEAYDWLLSRRESPALWRGKAEVLRALRRNKEAEAATQRASHLGVQ